MKNMNGVLFIHYDQGNERGRLAFQDCEFISPPRRGYPGGAWSPEGMHHVENGDELTVFEAEKREKELWSGIVADIDPMNLFPGIDGRIWIRWVLDEYPARLTKGENRG